MTRILEKPDMSVPVAIDARVEQWKQAEEGGDPHAVVANQLRLAVVMRVVKRVGMGLVRNEFPQKWLGPILDSLEEGVDLIYAEGGQMGSFAIFQLSENIAKRFESLELEKRLLAIEKKLK